MALNINFNINITFNHKNEIAQPVAQNTNVPQVLPVENTLKKYKRSVDRSTHANAYKHITRCDSEAVSLIQEKVNEIESTTKGLSCFAVLARAVKATRIPVATLSVIKTIKFSKEYKRTKRVKLSDEKRKDLAALIAGGASYNIISIIFEMSPCSTISAETWKYISKVTPKNVEYVRNKYKDILTLYGEYDSLSYDKRNYTGRKFKHATVEEAANARASNTLSPEQVKEMVSAYESLPIIKGSSIVKDMQSVIRMCGITADTATVQRMIFAHKHLKGYENIPTPDVRNVVINGKWNRSQGEINLIKEIRYLRDTKKWSIGMVTKTLGLKREFVKSVYYALIRPDIKVEPKMEDIFDQRYAGKR